MSGYRHDREQDRGPRELAVRQGDGLQVTLAWDPADGTLTVSVEDLRDGAVLRVPVGADRPMDVFHHPYAYAARRGVAAEARRQARGRGGTPHATPSR
jgi:hypothetical protein